MVQNIIDPNGLEHAKKWPEAAAWNTGFVKDVRKQAGNCLHFSMCACHPCAVAMLIFSASFQFRRMIPEG